MDEIAEQPEAVRRTVSLERKNLTAVAAAIQRYAPAYIVIAARGTSDHAAVYARYLWAVVNGLPVMLDAPSLTTMYHETRHLRRALVMGISQSGESTDVVEVIHAARQEGALTLAITNNAGSSLASAAQEVALCHSGPERAVAATKTYTTQLAILGLLSALLAGDTELLAALDRVPDAMARVLEQTAPITATARRFASMPACVVLGRGYNFSTALEVALKLKETSYLWAEPYSPADFQHGPIALLEQGTPLLAFLAPGQVYENVRQTLGTVRQRGVDLVLFGPSEAVPADAISADSHRPLTGNSVTVIDLPRVLGGLAISETVSPLVYTMAGQIFACALCVAKGYDPDRPRGLTKVTFTL
jgi:glucosamine--fructose-6-phosphate aminotransferase (isomerizing)